MGVFTFILTFWITFEIAYSYKYVDLSHSINVNTALWPGHRKFERNVVSEDKDANGNWIADFSYIMTEHMSTHLDAPQHVFNNRRTLHEIPLEQIMNIPGIKVDVSHKVLQPNGKDRINYAVNKQDFIDWERKNGRIPPKCVVLVRTGWDTKWEKPDEFLGLERFENGSFKSLWPGLEYSAARFLALERNVYGVGVDVVSIDVGYSKANLVNVPVQGFKVWIFPLSLGEYNSGSPVRIFAIF